MEYQPVASHAGNLFCTVAELAAIDNMYQFSLEWFMEVFDAVITVPHTCTSVAQRCDTLNAKFTYETYQSVCRGLFERHKLLFALLLAVRPLQYAGSLDPLEWTFLVMGPTVASQSQAELLIPNPAAEWLSETVWDDVSALSRLQSFGKSFIDSFGKNLPAWKEFFDCPAPHKYQLPAGWCKTPSPLSRLLILRVMRPDKIKEGIQDFIVEHMGKEYIEFPQFDLEVSYNSSKPQKPLIFLLSPGTDPAAAVRVISCSIANFVDL